MECSNNPGNNLTFNCDTSSCKSVSLVFKKLSFLVLEEASKCFNGLAAYSIQLEIIGFPFKTENLKFGLASSSFK